MSESNLRKAVIRLAKEKPNLRKDLLPLFKTARADARRFLDMALSGDENAARLLFRENQRSPGLLDLDQLDRHQIKTLDKVLRKATGNKVWIVPRNFQRNGMLASAFNVYVILDKDMYPGQGAAMNSMAKDFDVASNLQVINVKPEWEIVFNESETSMYGTDIRPDLNIWFTLKSSANILMTEQEQGRIYDHILTIFAGRLSAIADDPTDYPVVKKGIFWKDDDIEYPNGFDVGQTQ